MMSFLEYVARRREAGLPGPTTMLAMLGIDPHGPHDVEVMRMVKDERKRAGGSANKTLVTADVAHTLRRRRSPGRR